MALIPPFSDPFHGNHGLSFPPSGSTYRLLLSAVHGGVTSPLPLKGRCVFHVNNVSVFFPF